MTLDEEWDPTIYTTNVPMDEQLWYLPLIPKGTCGDDYDDKGNLVLNTEIMVTTVDEDGNTIGDPPEDGDSLDGSDDNFSTFGNIISLTDLFSGYDCIGSGNSSKFTTSSKCESSKDSSGNGISIKFITSYECESSKGSSILQQPCQQLHCQWRCNHHKYYRAPPLPSCPPHTNKHKQRCCGIHIHFSNSDDDVSMPGIQTPVDDDNISVKVIPP